MITRREMVLTSIVMSFGFAILYKATEPKRQEARRASCYSNLKQIGIALAQYANDNDNTYPRAFYGRDAGASNAQTNYKWMDAVLPYIKNTDIFTCPSDNVSQFYRRRSGRAYGSYVMNNAYFSPNDKQTPPSGINLDKIASPSYTVLLTDGENDFQFAWPDAQHTPTKIGVDPFQLDSIRGRHDSRVYGSAPALGCDGSTSSALHDLARRTNVIEGQKIYTAFTVENDEPWVKN